MLKVNGFRRLKDSALEFDGLLPLSFKCSEVREVCDVASYYQIGNRETSFVEFGIVQKDGAVFDISVVALNNIVRDKANPTERRSTDVEIIQALPLCDVEQTGELSYFDIDVEVVAVLFRNSILVYFDKVPTESRLFQMGRMMIGIDENDEICSLRAFDLRESEVENFLLSVTSSN